MKTRFFKFIFLVILLQVGLFAVKPVVEDSVKITSNGGEDTATIELVENSSDVTTVTVTAKDKKLTYSIGLSDETFSQPKKKLRKPKES